MARLHGSGYWRPTIAPTARKADHERTAAATMTCVEIKKPGGPEALVPTTRPVPQARTASC